MGEVLFILAQCFGAIALIMYAISMQKTKRTDMLKWNAIYSVFSAAQYACLMAFSGCASGLIQIARDMVFRRYKKKVPVAFLAFFIIIVALSGAIFYDGPVSLLPVIHTITCTIFMSKDNMTHYRLMMAFAAILMLTYNIYVGAYVGIVIVILQFVSAIVGIVRFDSDKIKKIL